MTAHSTTSAHAAWLPRTAPGAGEVLWAEPPRSLPIVPLVVLAIVTCFVAAPMAFSGNGASGNPIRLMRDVAKSTYTITELTTSSNEMLTKIDENVTPLAELDTSMSSITENSIAMRKTTEKMNASLSTVGGSVTRTGQSLNTVSTSLNGLSSDIAPLAKGMDSSLKSTQAIVADFGVIGNEIDAMDEALASAVRAMGVSAPATKAFANNRTVKAVAGGDGRKYGVANAAKGTRVMSVMLPMIATMQQGGNLPARKDSAEASNPLVGWALKQQVPDGTNVFARVTVFDGTYGLPGRDWFVNHKVNGF